MSTRIKSFTRNTEKAHLKNIVRFKVNVPPEAAHYLFANVAHFVNVDQIWNILELSFIFDLCYKSMK